MYCPDCGCLNRQDAKFCVACRSPLGAPGAPWRRPLQPDQLMDNGRYRIIRPLGKGGMGAVYLAENLQAFGREVVVKEMLDYFDPTDPEQVERARNRFEAEARTLAALKHPAVPDIYGYFSQGGRNYLVMEFVVGENLETGVTHRDGEGRLIPALPYTTEQVVHFGAQLCDLLEYLARRKDPDSGQLRPVIHHDIKLANIVRDPEADRVWLVDFGTAKSRIDAAAADQLDTTAGQPQEAKESVFGTVGYAPPEQYQGESTPRSDVYALAATLYHLLTDDDPRDHPFQFGRLDELPLELRLALHNALAQEVEARSTAGEFKAALTNALPDQPAGESQPLAFPDGKSAQSLSDVPRLALQHWDYARGILYSGDLEHWFRRSIHNPVVADTAKRIAGATSDQDTGLDSFLRELDPDLPGGHLQLAQRSVDLGTVTTSKGTTATLSLSNSGPGYSHGSITSSADWLREADGSFSVKPGGSEQLVIDADTTPLTPGQRYKETLTLTPADGSKPLRLEVALEVAEARVICSPLELVFDVAEGDPDPQDVSLTNTGGENVTCTLTRDEQWLLVRPKQLTLPAGQRASATVTIRLARLPLASKPRTQITVTPSHGPVTAIPVAVVTRRSRGVSRALVALAVVSLVALMISGAVRLLRGRTFGPAAAPAPPPHTAQELDIDVAVVDGFEMDRYEVTNLQYARYDTAHAYETGDELLPAVDASWEDARLYCEWAGKRLPTLQQWQDAAQLNRGWLFPWGNEADYSRLNSDNNRETSGLVPVGSFPAGASPHGIYDLLGNASEWVIGGGADQYRQIQAGGSWRHFALTNSLTFHETRQSAPGSIGFRCVRPVDSESAE